jgi:hypothetical protein
MRLINRRKINDYKMALAIATNPHIKDHKRLWHTLDAQERQNEGKDYLDAEFDINGFEVFKQTLQRQSKGIIIKGGEL